MSLTTKTPEHIVLAYNSPRGRAVGRGKLAEAAAAAEVAAEAPQAAQAAQAPEGRTVCRGDNLPPDENMTARRFPTVDQGLWCGLCRFVMKWVAELGKFWCCCLFKEGPI